MHVREMLRVAAHVGTMSNGWFIRQLRLPSRASLSVFYHPDSARRRELQWANNAWLRPGYAVCAFPSSDIFAKPASQGYRPLMAAVASVDDSPTIILQPCASAPDS